MIVAASLIRRPRTKRWCDTCGKPLGNGATVRLYGCAHIGDPKYTLFVHPACIHPDAMRAEPKLAAVVDAYLQTTGGRR